MSKIENDILFEFRLKTPYFIISSQDMTAARQSLITCAVKAGKSLLFWNETEGLYHVVSSNAEYICIDDILLASLGKTEDEKRMYIQEISTLGTRTEKKDHGILSNITQALNEAANKKRGDTEKEALMDEVTAAGILRSTKSEEDIFFWWIKIASHTLHNVIFCMEGDFFLHRKYITEFEGSPSHNPAVRLTTRRLGKLSDDASRNEDTWIVCTDVTPVLQFIPDTDMFRDLLCETLKEYHIPFPTEDVLTAASQALIGISTLHQAKDVYTRVIARAGKFGREEISELYKLRDKTVGVYNTILTPVYIDEGDAQLGGLDLLKQWIHLHKNLSSPEAKAYGLHPPKGILLCGPPGTGKTICAKYIARLLDYPLLILNTSLTFRCYVGDSEEMLKQTFDYVDSFGKCVLMMDEIEKILGEGDYTHEITRRIMAIFLTWQSCRSSEAFVIASSNSLCHLPPEFMRAGRFDKVFYVDLPGKAERAEILDLHLRIRNHGGVFGEKELELFADNTGGFSGSELEMVVETALLESYQRDMHLHIDDVLSAIKTTKPLSLSRMEEITQQRTRAREQASPASSCSYEAEVGSAKMEGNTGEEIHAYYG